LSTLDREKRSSDHVRLKTLMHKYRNVVGDITTLSSHLNSSELCTESPF